MAKFSRYILIGASALVLAACDQANFSILKSLTATSIATDSADESFAEQYSTSELDALIKNSTPEVDFNAGFKKAMLQAVDQHPAVLAAKKRVDASKESLLSTKSDGETRISTTVLGGAEDITDRTVGIAAILTAERTLYDGGILNARIDSDTFKVQAAEQFYLATRDDRALSLARAWIDLELYQSLTNLINSRLAVLDPLLEQLENVANSGVGDVSQVAAAQRIVSSILFAETNVTESYRQAELSFINGFGGLPVKTRYDASWVSSGLPTSSNMKLAESSPSMLAKFWEYRASEASVVAIRARDDFNIGLQLKVQRPFGGSDVGSDESVGVALTKAFYRGNQLESKVKSAEALAHALAAEVAARYRSGELALLGARQMIISMDKAIGLARSNAKSSREEIEYLRKQLIIGGSTLESVLSAEARLYDAESKEIGFIAERLRAEASILAISGNFSRALGL
jgi:outer membrane protein TolC